MINDNYFFRSPGRGVPLKALNFRTFRDAKIQFVHSNCDFDALGMGTGPKLPNLNLVLGTNGQGKTTALKAVALAALGPAVSDSGIYPFRLIRREPKESKHDQASEAVIGASFVPHPQDGAPRGLKRIQSEVKVTRRGDLERLRWTHGDEKLWHPIFSSESDAFFFVGYGATRRVEKRESMDLASRKSSAFSRALRIQGLFEDSHSLIPLNTWLPRYETENPGRFKQVVNLINRLLDDRNFRFTGEMEDGEYVFHARGLRVPFPALSDGYRAFLGWIGDLLYHVCETCPSGKKLVDNRGIVMVDEVDLHIHPEWQMSILPTLARCIPNLQFILTTHSPLLVGSLEWMNILVARFGTYGSSTLRRIREPVHGMDADQVLLTEYFGLETTRAPGKAARLKDLTLQARLGDRDAARKLLMEMSSGDEGAEGGTES